MSGERSSTNARDGEPITGVITEYKPDGTIVRTHARDCGCLECYLERNKKVQAGLRIEPAPRRVVKQKRKAR
jgi:hypothetical protein